MPKQFHFLLLPLLVLIVNSCKQITQTVTSPKILIQDSLSIWNKDVNAYTFVFIDSNNQIYQNLHGFDKNKQPITEYTIFEAASLSKTLTAFLFWKISLNDSSILKPVLWPKCNTKDSIWIHPYQLLKHSVKSEPNCLIELHPNSFQYSENAYLLLQKLMEKHCQKGLEALAQEHIFKPLKMSHSTFIWNNFESRVDGFIKDTLLQRNMYQFNEALSHGSLYSCSHDLLLFVLELRKSNFLDFVEKESLPVQHHTALNWGLGMGIEVTQSDTLFWQWGSNWCYNHILMHNKTTNISIIALSNSIIGAKRGKEACDKILGKHLTLFNYINWY
jgi:CubicO group peptidase (beta-lactamase class C family)